ncbi:MAG: hypothetical protein E6Q43_03790, partial [Dokdonella sp.]
FTLAESLGGVESLIEHPAIMTHASVPADIRAKLGIADGFVRVSCGIEHVDDLLADLDQALAKQQCSGFGGMISFDLRGDLAAARRFLEAVRVFTLAESLGGVESLIEHPAIMTHASVPPANRKRLGISDGLIRLSVGVENLHDLKRELASALES